MKYQRLVSNTTPSSLQNWLEQELGDRGIDSVYARSVLSLLQQDYIDIEPLECHHGRRRRLKELHKNGVPGKTYVTKSKHQKWRSREMQTLLMPSYPCCNAVLTDMEKLKKKAAVDCLISASDYINDIEELIDEVWKRLKSEKNLKGEKEEKKFKDAFFIPPSSPTDEIEKYFAAFPPLNDKVGDVAAIDQCEITENVWYKRCVSKKKLETQDEVSHDSGSLYLRSPTRGCQPIIPYNSLKPIRNTYKNLAVVPPLTLNKKEKEFHMKSKKNHKKFSNNKKELVFQVSLGPRRLSLGIQFRQLSTINFNDCSFQKNDLIDHIHGTNIKNLWDAFKDSACRNSVKIVIAKINSYRNIPKHEILPNGIEEISPLISVLPDINLVPTIENNELASYEKHAPVCEIDPAQDSISNCLENHFELWGSGDTFMNYLDITRSVLSSLSLGDYSNDWMLGSSEDETRNSLDSIYSYENESIFSELGITHAFSEYKDKNDSALSYYSLWEPKKSAFETLLEKTEVPKEDKMNITEKYDSIAEFSFGLPHEQEKIFEDISDNEIIKDEVFFSDEDSPSIFSCEDENFFTSSKTHFQPISSSNSLSDSGVVESEIQLNDLIAAESCTTRIQDIPDANFISSISLERKVIKSESLSSSCEELSFFSDYQLEKPHSSKACHFKHKGSDSSSTSPTVCVPSFIENFPLNKLVEAKSSNENWLFHWGENHRYVADVWQKENESLGEKDNEGNYNSEIYSSLSMQIENDGEELLKSVMSHVLEDSAKHSSVECTPSPTDLNSKSPYIEDPIEEPEIIYLDSEISSEQNNIYELPSQLHEFCIDTNETNLIEDEFPQQAYNLCSSFYNAHEISDAKTELDDDENLYPLSRNYSEGGGWSLASESFTEFEFENSTDRGANSLGDLDLDNSGAKFLELYHQNRRIRCTSDTNPMTGSELALSMFQKRSKQKYASRKRPCSFFLQGKCTRSDCKFSHDLSSTTCRFWKEGSCFKGDTCPFLHGYINETEQVPKGDYYLKSEIDDNKYSLESELDFPSLSTAPDKEPKEKSIAIDIKLSGSKKTKEKFK